MPLVPVPGVAMVMRFSVIITFRSMSLQLSMIFRNSGSRWPRIGAVMARSTRGWAPLGPGPMSTRVGGLNVGEAVIAVS